VQKTEQIVPQATTTAAGRYVSSSYTPPPTITVKKPTLAKEFGRTLDLRLG